MTKKVENDMKFTKMQGCGNDYVYINGFAEHVEEKEEFVKRISDRHFGVGGDGAIFINPSSIADFEMEMYNADGTRAEMCGNGIRCVAKYVYDYGLTDKTSITIESCGQIKYVDLTVVKGKAVMVRVNMGAPQLQPGKIPVRAGKEMCIHEPIEVQGDTYYMTCVSMGNPHAVVFLENEDKTAGEKKAWQKSDAGQSVLAGQEMTDNLDRLDIEHIGPFFENHERFPNRINTEFVKIVDRTRVKMRVWERGTGETLACGTGCCAVGVAGVLNGLTEDKVTVEVLGGEILVEWDRENNLVYMTGPAEVVFEGEYPWGK